MLESKHKHLEFIQGVINRLSTNSFLLKGWTVLLISALFAIGAYKHSAQFFWLAYFPAVVFWLLDGYYMTLERRYRCMYDLVRKRVDETDFDLNPSKFNDYEKWLPNCFRPAVSGFHVPLLLIILVISMLTQKGA